VGPGCAAWRGRRHGAGALDGPARPQPRRPARPGAHPDGPGGVRVQFVKEQLTFTGEDTAMATLLLSVMGAFAEFERSLIRERQREGIALARQRGAYRGRTPALNIEQVAQLRQRVADGIPKPPWPASSGSAARPFTSTYARPQRASGQADRGDDRAGAAPRAGRRGVPQPRAATPLSRRMRGRRSATRARSSTTSWDSGSATPRSPSRR